MQSFLKEKNTIIRLNINITFYKKMWIIKNNVYYCSAKLTDVLPDRLRVEMPRDEFRNALFAERGVLWYPSLSK